VKGFDPEHVTSVVRAVRNRQSRPCGQKKPSALGRGWEAFLLSHIKAPAQGGKAGGSKLPVLNLSNNKTDNKLVSNFFIAFDN
jgi:hypothetical protein